MAKSILAQFRQMSASLSEKKIRALLAIGLEMGGNISDDNDEPDVIAKPIKKSVGRPKKTTEEDIELTANKKRNSAKSGKKETAAAPKKAATVKVPANVDFGDMDKSQRIAAAKKMGIENAKLLKGDATTVKILTAINKLASNENREVSAVEKMAKKAGVDLIFKRGRPPATDEGLKRRILVLMANENALATN